MGGRKDLFASAHFYILMIHCYKLNGYNIVLDIASGSIHSVDDAAFDAISMYGNAGVTEIIEQIRKKYLLY